MQDGVVAAMPTSAGSLRTATRNWALSTGSATVTPPLAGPPAPSRSHDVPPPSRPGPSGGSAPGLKGSSIATDPAARGEADGRNGRGSEAVHGFRLPQRELHPRQSLLLWTRAPPVPVVQGRPIPDMVIWPAVNPPDNTEPGSVGAIRGSRCSTESSLPPK